MRKKDPLYLFQVKKENQSSYGYISICRRHGGNHCW